MQLAVLNYCAFVAQNSFLYTLYRFFYISKGSFWISELHLRYHVTYLSLDKDPSSCKIKVDETSSLYTLAADLIFSSFSLLFNEMYLSMSECSYRFIVPPNLLLLI